MANRLKRVVGKVFNVAHNTFVEGIQILDASLIANEIMDSLLKKNGKMSPFQAGYIEGL